MFDARPPNAGPWNRDTAPARRLEPPATRLRDVQRQIELLDREDRATLRPWILARYDVRGYCTTGALRAARDRQALTAMFVRAERFGERLRRLRVDRRISCAQLAHRVGVTEGAIRQMESGQTKMASFVIGLRLARELGVEACYLANGSGDDDASYDPDASLARRVEALEARITRLDGALRPVRSA